MATPTGVSQDTLNTVLRAGGISDATRFGASNIDAIANQTALPNNLAQKIQPIQITEQNAPNTTFQDRQLTNQFLDVNRQAFELQNQMIGNQANLQQQALTRQAKDAMNQNLLMYGASGAIDSRDSSRNLSNLTSVEAKLSQELGNVRMKALELSNQNIFNYAQQNLTGLQMNKQADFQNRQFNLQESLQRGQETGMVFEYNPATGKVESTNKLNLAGKAMEAEMTGDYTTFEGQKVRSLTGLQVDASLITNQLENAIGVSRLTGEIPNLAGIKTPDGRYNPNFDFTKGTGRLTQDALLNAGAIAQSGYNANLYGTMNEQGLYQDQVALERENIRTALGQNAVQQELNRLSVDYYKQQLGEAGGQLVSNVDQAMEKLKNAKTPDEEARALQELELANQGMVQKYGEGNGLYYKIEGKPKTDSKGNIIGFENELAVDANALKKRGINFDIDFNRNNDLEKKAQEALYKEFQDGLSSRSDISRFINKMMVSGADKSGNEYYLSLAARNGDGTIGNGYEFMKLNTSNMKPADKIAFTVDIAKAGAETPAELDVLSKLIKDYEGKGLQRNVVGATDFVKNMRASGASNGSFFGVDGVTNDKIARIGFLSNTPSFKKMIQSDVNLNKFDNDMINLRNSLEVINSKIEGKGLSNEQVNTLFEKIKTNLAEGKDTNYTVPNTGVSITLPKLDKEVLNSLNDYMLSNKDNINYAKNMIHASLPMTGKDTLLPPGTFKLTGRTFDLGELFKNF